MKSYSNAELSSWIKVNEGLYLGGNHDSWFVVGNNNVYEFKNSLDYLKVISLLERPYKEIKLLIDLYKDKNNISITFPLGELVKAGLASQSEYWAEKSINWLGEMPIEISTGLILELEEFMRSKLISQKVKHKAQKEYQKIIKH